jgi:hypothetical protein
MCHQSLRFGTWRDDNYPFISRNYRKPMQIVLALIVTAATCVYSIAMSIRPRPVCPRTKVLGRYVPWSICHRTIHP